jgi:hypothetical protein
MIIFKIEKRPIPRVEDYITVLDSYFSLGNKGIVKKMSGEKLVDESTSLWLELARMSPFSIRMNT